MPTHILPFEKLHGLGNDFIVIHHKHLPPHISESQLAKTLCDRHFSIGADGLIIAKPGGQGATTSSDTTSDFAWEYLNSDGSLAEMCGNGMRCLARYLSDRGLAKDPQFTVSTRDGLKTCQINEDNSITINLGSTFQLAPQLESVKSLDRQFDFLRVSVGNPHAVIFLSDDSDDEDLQNFDLESYGQAIEQNADLFAQKTNVEFAKMLSDTEIDLRVWERGCGATLACATGAAATVLAAQALQKAPIDQQIIVNLPGGKLSVQQKDGQIYLRGPAVSVFVGQLELQV